LLFTLAVKYTGVRLWMECTGGILTALWLLAKKLSSLEQLNFQASSIRMEWKRLSTSRLSGLTFSPGKQSDLGCFMPSVVSARSVMHLPTTKSTRTVEEFNHPGMNTCTKIGGGYPLLSDAVLAFRVVWRVRYSSAASLAKSAIRSWIAVPSDQRKRGISPELPQLNARSVLTRQSAAQIPAKERELERE